jgi:riboflavin kinase/FMN adenylyltransferase
VERKASLIEQLGVDSMLVLEFTREFSRWAAEDFIERVLVGGLHVRHVVVGANFTFGFKAAGRVDTLVELGPKYSFTAEGVDLLSERERRISSSSVRDAIAAADLVWPEIATGRRFVLDGEVVAGAGRGRELGYPTANLRTWPRLLLPGRGIYAGRAEHAGRTFRAAISVGTNPTFGIEPLHVEAYLLDFDGDLLGDPISVEFWTYLRDELRFESVDELVRAIDEDVRRTEELVPPAGN